VKTRLKNRVGDTYWPWVVISYLRKDFICGKWTHFYLCKCDICEIEKEINARRFYHPPVCINLCNKKSRAPTHGKSRSPEYRIWTSMKGRCLTKTNHHYHRYGGIGVTVCKSWLKFENFYSDMGDRPMPEHSIDRINGKEGY